MHPAFCVPHTLKLCPLTKTKSLLMGREEGLLLLWVKHIALCMQSESAKMSDFFIPNNCFNILCLLLSLLWNIRSTKFLHIPTLFWVFAFELARVFWVVAWKLWVWSLQVKVIQFEILHLLFLVQNELCAKYVWGSWKTHTHTWTRPLLPFVIFVRPVMESQCILVPP